MHKGTNHAIDLVSCINKSTNSRLYVSKYKTLEYDLAMEGNNASLMSEIIASLWPEPTNGKSTVITEFTEMSKQDWTKKQPREVAEAAHKILKKIDDDNIGKGLFAQVLTNRIQLNEYDFSVPEYIKKAIMWASSVDFEEEE